MIRKKIVEVLYRLVYFK